MLPRQVTVAVGDDMAYANTDSATVTHKTLWDLAVASQAQARRQQETFFALTHLQPQLPKHKDTDNNRRIDRHTASDDGGNHQVPRGYQTSLGSPV